MEIENQFYPILFSPILIKKVWGGNLISEFCKLRNTPEKIGESWEISPLKENESIVSNGCFKGEKINTLIEKYGNLILGKKYKGENKFPLLIKYIDASENLSLQLHPDRNFEFEEKNELWYIINTKSKKIIYGLPDNLKLEKAIDYIKEKKFNKIINYFNIKNEEMIYVPAGMLHAILKGTFLLEIQQPSYTTFRVYDWDRNDKNRKLHIKESIKNLKSFPDKNQFLNFGDTDYFYVEPIIINKNKLIDLYGEFIVIANVSNQNLEINYNEKKIILNAGRITLIPAILNKIIIYGDNSKILIIRNKNV